MAIIYTDEVRISELPESVTPTEGDLIEISTPTPQGDLPYASKKMSFNTFANWIVSVLNFNSLNTISKTIIGAINEIKNKNLNDLGDVTITTPTNGQYLKYNDQTQEWENSGADFYFDVIATLSQGNNTVTLTDPRITTNMTVQIFVHPNFYGVVPGSITIEAGRCILTFPSQSSYMPVKARFYA